MTNYRILRVVLLLLLGSLLVTRAVALEVVGSVGGTCPSVAARDGYVYLCEGRGLTVLDARAVGDPVVVERVRLDAGTTCVRLDNDVAYVGTVEGKVRLYSLANPASPTLLSTITLIGGSLTDAAFEGNHAFFANEGGVEIVDISNPATPVPVSRYGGLSGDDGAKGVCVSGSKMYLATYQGARVIDVSDPTNPQFVAPIPKARTSLGYLCNRAEDIGLSGGYLYMVWGREDYLRLPYFDAAAGVYRFNDAGVPELVASRKVPILPSDLLLSEALGRAYVLSEEKSLCSEYDSSTPPEFEWLSESRFPWRVSDGALDGTNLFIADESGLTSGEISSSGTVAIAGRYFSIRLSRSLVTCGAYQVASEPNGFVIVDTDRPSTPKSVLWNSRTASILSTAASGRFLYLSNIAEGLDVRYITPEPTIANVATLNPLAWENIEDPLYGGVAASGETVWMAYFGGRTGAWKVGVMGFDISNPLRPKFLGLAGRGSTASELPIPQVAVSGSRACIAADKLYFFDLTDSSSPGLLSEVQRANGDWEDRVFWSDDFVVFLDGDDRLMTVNASDAANPVLLAPSPPIPGGGSLEWVENGRAYIAREFALDVYRVVPGGEPVLLESLPSRGYVRSVEMYGGHVYAMDSEDGLLVMKTNFPDHLAQRHLLGSDTGAADQNGDGVIDAADLVLAMAAARE